jgi:hypothetical protein
MAPVTQAFYVGVRDGNHSQGLLAVNDNVFPAASGNATHLDIPEGNYTYGDEMALEKKQRRTMTDGKGPMKNFGKFPIGTGPKGEGDLPDARRPKTPRTVIRLHYDGGSIGTEGCIGFQDNAAKDALIANPDKRISVIYVKNIEEARALIEQKLGHKVDWSKVKPNRTPEASGKGDGTHSKNRKGKKVKKANRRVLSGPRRRQTAQRLSLLEGGVQVADASTTVFIEGLGVARVNDMTTDGSPVADGEGSILVG